MRDKASALDALRDYLTNKRFREIT